MAAANDAPPSPPTKPVRRLVGEIVDEPRTFAFDNGAPAVPASFNGFPSPDREVSFADRFGNWPSTGAGTTPRELNPFLPRPPAGDGGIFKYFGDNPAQLPASSAGDGFSSPTSAAQQSQVAAPPYTGEYRQYLNQLDRSQPPTFALDPSNLPPLFAPPDYYAAPPDNSLQRWLASLAGVDREEAAEFEAPTVFSPFYQR